MTTGDQCVMTDSLTQHLQLFVALSASRKFHIYTWHFVFMFLCDDKRCIILLLSVFFAQNTHTVLLFAPLGVWLHSLAS